MKISDIRKLTTDELKKKSWIYVMKFQSCHFSIVLDLLRTHQKCRNYARILREF